MVTFATARVELDLLIVEYRVAVDIETVLAGVLLAVLGPPRSTGLSHLLVRVRRNRDGVVLTDGLIVRKLRIARDDALIHRIHDGLLQRDGDSTLDLRSRIGRLRSVASCDSISRTNRRGVRTLMVRSIVQYRCSVWGGG